MKVKILALLFFTAIILTGCSKTETEIETDLQVETETETETESKTAPEEDSDIEAFIRGIFETALGREIPEANLKEWSKDIAEGKRSAYGMARHIFGSNEYNKKEKLVSETAKEIYLTLLDRKGDEKGLQSLEMILKDEGLDKAIFKIVKSNEFIKRAEKLSINNLLPDEVEGTSEDPETVEETEEAAPVETSAEVAVNVPSSAGRPENSGTVSVNSNGTTNTNSASTNKNQTVGNTDNTAKTGKTESTSGKKEEKATETKAKEPETQKETEIQTAHVHSWSYDTREVAYTAEEPVYEEELVPFYETRVKRVGALQCARCKWINQDDNVMAAHCATCGGVGSNWWNITIDDPTGATEEVVAGYGVREVQTGTKTVTKYRFEGYYYCTECGAEKPYNP